MGGGAMRELNPLMKPLVENFDLPGLLAAKAGYLGYLWFVTKHRDDIHREETYFFAALLGSVATINNASELVWHGHGRMLLPRT